MTTNSDDVLLPTLSLTSGITSATQFADSTGFHMPSIQVDKTSLIPVSAIKYLSRHEKIKIAAERSKKINKHAFEELARL